MDIHQNGLVISPPVVFDGDSMSGSSNFDPMEIRFSLLYWDKLAWPSNNLVYISNLEAEFLEGCGILVRPSIRFNGGVYGNKDIAHSHVMGFQYLNRKEPGKWSLAQGDTSFLLKEKHLEEGRGCLVSLYRAIPVPNRDVPFQDILNFKEKRRSELHALRQTMSEFYEEIANCSDQDHAFRVRIQKIDLTCSDLLKTMREWKRPFRLSSLQLSLNKSIIGGVLGYAFGQSQDMPELTAISALAGLAAGANVNIEMGYGLKGTSLRNSPYRYVTSFHKQLFNRP